MKKTWQRPVINMDRPEYQELARRIEVYHDLGSDWVEAQRLALVEMGRRGIRIDNMIRPL